jgi:hypothetical protein
MQQWVDHLLESIQQLKEIKERAARGAHKGPRLITERDIQVCCTFKAPCPVAWFAPWKYLIGQFVDEVVSHWQ